MLAGSIDAPEYWRSVGFMQRRQVHVTQGPLGTAVTPYPAPDCGSRAQPIDRSGRPLIQQHTHRLQIRRCEIATWIGVYEHEQAGRTTLLFDLDLDIDGRKASAADRIGETVDYGEVVQDLRCCLHDKRHQLVESLVDFVADRLLDRFAALRVRVAISKVAVLPGVASVGVEVVRRRG